MKKYALVILTNFSLLVGLVSSCKQSGLNTVDLPPQIMQALVSDSASTAQIDQVTGLITITRSPFTGKPERDLIASIDFQTPPNTTISATNTEVYVSTLDTIQKFAKINFRTYNNANPLTFVLISNSHSRSVRKEYKIQIKSFGALRFEKLPPGRDTVLFDSSPNFKYGFPFISRDWIWLPVSNLYNGQPGVNIIRAISVADNTSVQLYEFLLRTNGNYIAIGLDPILFRPGLYTLELQTPNGQKAVPPLVLKMDK